MATVLLEIGTEEMPASYLPNALTQLGTLARTRLSAERIGVESVATWGTARRLALCLRGVAAQQAPTVREVRGPAVSVAFAANGAPTPAVVGFARSHGIPESELRVKEIDGVEYLIAAFHDEGRPTVELLPAIFADLITALTFPRTMRWGESPVSFARPIRWMLAMQDDQPITFRVDGVTAGRLTRGHRFLAPGEVTVPHADAYLRVLEENHVLVEPEARREAIRQQLHAIAQAEEAEIVDDGSLLEETVYQVEFPTAVRCQIDESFLSLPPDLLVHVLCREQQLFPLTNRAGTLLPGFIAVRNGDKAYLGGVREGYEAVARAKLLDALFFFEQDLRRPLAERVEELHGIVFSEHLGTLHDKAVRIQHLAGIFAERMGWSAYQRQLAERAGLLCKADFVTALGAEHPEMRGALGAAFARRSGEPEAIADAIAEHVRPRNGADALPASELGLVTALADRLDTVVGCYAAGRAPSGGPDPFNVQGNALGIMRLLTGARLRLSLPQLIEDALAQLPTPPIPPEALRDALQALFRTALTTVLARDGIRDDVIAAVVPVSPAIPADALLRARVIMERLHDAAFKATVRAVSRLEHLGKPGESEPEPARLTEPAERELLTRHQELAPRAEFFASRGEFSELPNVYALLTEAVDPFLALPLGDPAARSARQALARRVVKLYHLLGELSRVVV